MIAKRDWPWIIRYLKAHGLGYYQIANEVGRRAPYRSQVPIYWQQIERYENGARMLWDDGQALIELYEELAPEEV